MHQSNGTARRIGVAVVVLAVLAAIGVAVFTGGNDTTKTSTSDGTGRAAGSLTGAGSTFQEPLVVKWGGAFAKDGNSGVPVNYQGVGSGAGIEQFTKGTVDFGATDAPMSDEELAAATKAHGGLVHVPVALGSVVVTYNLTGVDDLRLDGPTLAKIYLGSITKWNDDAIQQLNPDAKLPDTQIAVVHRGESSGTSFVFTGYLAKVSSAWTAGPGQSKEPKWPTGSGAQGSDGVAAAVQQQDGAIGYVEIAYALQNKLPFAQLQNASGEWVTASLDSTTKAGEGVTYPDDLRFDLLDSKTSGAYPIVSATWQLAWTDPAKAGLSKGRSQQLVDWLTWELNDGQAAAPALDYAPLPAALLTKAQAAVKTIDVG